MMGFRGLRRSGGQARFERPAEAQNRSSDCPICAQQHRLWNVKSKGLGGLEIDHQLEFGRLFQGSLSDGC